MITMAKKGFIPWNAGTSKTKATIKCECCGKIVTKYLHGRDNIRFCSNKCAHKIMPVWNKNKPWSDEVKQKISSSNKDKIFSDNLRQKLRKARVSYIKKVGIIKGPNIGKDEKHVLDVLEECFYPYLIKRQFYIAGYFLDGYCPALNLAIEVDEKFHNNLEQLQKDKYRENQIRNELNCQFLRIGCF